MAGAGFVASSTQSADGNTHLREFPTVTRLEDFNAGVFFTDTILSQSLMYGLPRHHPEGPTSSEEHYEFDFAAYLAPLIPDGQIGLTALPGDLRELPWEE